MFHAKHWWCPNTVLLKVTGHGPWYCQTWEAKKCIPWEPSQLKTPCSYMMSIEIIAEPWIWSQCWKVFFIFLGKRGLSSVTIEQHPTPVQLLPPCSAWKHISLSLFMRYDRAVLLGLFQYWSQHIWGHNHKLYIILQHQILKLF